MSSLEEILNVLSVENRMSFKSIAEDMLYMKKKIGLKGDVVMEELKKLHSAVFQEPVPVQRPLLMETAFNVVPVFSGIPQALEHLLIDNGLVPEGGIRVENPIISCIYIVYFHNLKHPMDPWIFNRFLLKNVEKTLDFLAEISGCSLHLLDILLSVFSRKTTSAWDSLPLLKKDEIKEFLMKHQRSEAAGNLVWESNVNEVGEEKKLKGYRSYKKQMEELKVSVDVILSGGDYDNHEFFKSKKNQLVVIYGNIGRKTSVGPPHMVTEGEVSVFLDEDGAMLSKTNKEKNVVMKKATMVIRL